MLFSDNFKVEFLENFSLVKKIFSICKFDIIVNPIFKDPHYYFVIKISVMVL